MYVEKLDLENIRTFTGGKGLTFVHPDLDFRLLLANSPDKQLRLLMPTFIKRLFLNLFKLGTVIPISEAMVK